MAAHITYLSETALQRKFGRNLQDRETHTFSFDADFQVESYLRHQGLIFIERFDPNSYLYMTRAMDYFDLAADFDGSLVQAFQHPNPLLRCLSHQTGCSRRPIRGRSYGAERRGRLGLVRRDRD